MRLLPTAQKPVLVTRHSTTLIHLTLCASPKQNWNMDYVLHSAVSKQRTIYFPEPVCTNHSSETEFFRESWINQPRSNSVKDEWQLLGTFFALSQIDNFIIIRLMAGDSGFEFRQGQEIFFFSTTSTSAPRPNQRPIPSVPGFFLRGKWARFWVAHSPPISAEVKNEWRCNSTPTVCLHGVERHNFTFTSHQHNVCKMIGIFPLFWQPLCTFWTSHFFHVCEWPQPVYASSTLSNVIFGKQVNYEAPHGAGFAYFDIYAFKQQTGIQRSPIILT